MGRMIVTSFQIYTFDSNFKMHTIFVYDLSATIAADCQISPSILKIMFQHINILL